MKDPECQDSADETCKYIHLLWYFETTFPPTCKARECCACSLEINMGYSAVINIYFIYLFIYLFYTEREMFYLTTHSTHFIYGYMASDIWLRTILIVRKETRCRHIGYSFRLAARVLLYAPSHKQDNTYHGLCYTNRGALAGTRNKYGIQRSD